MKTPDYLSDVTQLSLNKIPGFVKNWLVLSFLFVFVLILSLAFFIKFPQKVIGDIQFTNESPDIPIVSKGEGRLVLLVKNQQEIFKGTILGYLESPADFTDVYLLDTLLSSIPDESPLINDEETRKRLTKAPLNLGILQEDFEQFCKRSSDLRFMIEEGNLSKKLESLNKQKKEVENKIWALEQQKQISVQEIATLEANYKTDQQLHNEGVISDYDFNIRKKSYLATKRTLQDLTFFIAENKELLEKLNYEAIDLQSGYHQKVFELTQHLRSDIKVLKTRIAEWKDRNILIAPKTGLISFAISTENARYVKNGDPVLYLVPRQQTTVIANLTMSSYQTGEVRKGQKVIIKLNGYPYEKYGVLFGQVDFISEKQEGDKLLVQVMVDQSLTSSTGYQFRYIQDMTGIGEIIIANQNLAGKVVNTINQFEY